MGMLRQLDRNDDRQVSKEEFRQALPLLGFDAGDTEVIDEIFDELDEDGSGTLQYEELWSKLRQGADIELAASLQEVSTLR